MADENQTVDSDRYGDMIMHNNGCTRSVITFKTDQVLLANGEHSGAVDPDPYLDATQVTWPVIQRE